VVSADHYIAFKFTTKILKAFINRIPYTALISFGSNSAILISISNYMADKKATLEGGFA
jgi:hypothetical protein